MFDVRFTQHKNDTADDGAASGDASFYNASTGTIVRQDVTCMGRGGYYSDAVASFLIDRDGVDDSACTVGPVFGSGATYLLESSKARGRIVRRAYKTTTDATANVQIDRYTVPTGETWLLDIWVTAKGVGVDKGGGWNSVITASKPAGNLRFIGNTNPIAHTADGLALVSCIR